MKKSVFHILVWTLAVVALGAAGVRGGFWEAGSAEGAGNLDIDWGVIPGTAVFNEPDFLPGQLAEANVLIINNSTFDRSVGVQSVETAATDGLAGLLDVVISQTGIGDLYGGGSGTGPKVLADLFTESVGPEGIELMTVGGGDTEELIFSVSLLGSVSDESVQGDSTMFDITLGVVGSETAVPEECSDIEFDGEPIMGTDGSDSLRGTAGNDLIFGLEGSDSLRGYGGDDCLVGGSGSDSLRGYAGADVLLGGEGSDSLRGNDGPDTLYGGEGKDSLKGGRGNDVLFGGEGDDSLKGGRDDDVLTGGDGEDVAKGQQGVDVCDAEVEKTCEL